MDYNRLTVGPTQETLSYLSSLFSGAPVELDLSSMRVEIITTQDALEIDPSRVYASQALNVNTFYDSNLQSSNLMCTLLSQDLQARALELNQEGVERAFYDWYIPYFPIKRFVMNSESYRRWRVSIANALCSNERILTWEGESVEIVDINAYPDFEYIQAMAAELQYRHNV